MNDKDRPWRRQQLDEALRAMKDFAEECGDQFSWYSRRATVERSRAQLLTLSASIVATVAGAGSLSEIGSPTLVGITALVSAVLGTIATFFTTNAKKADTFTARAEAFQQLQSDIVYWVRVDALDPQNKLEAVDMLRDFRDRRKEVELGLPLRTTPKFGSPGPNYQEDLNWVVQEQPPSV
jgi:hypothetical protein